MKLLNINAAAKHLILNYKGATLSPQSSIFATPIAHSKSKILLAKALNDGLKGLVSSESLVRRHVNTGMGFVIGKYHTSQWQLKCGD